MHDTARVGDRIVVEATIVDHGRRHGEVLEVIDGAADQPRYRVRWDDRSESIFVPGPDAHVERS